MQLKIHAQFYVVYSKECGEKIEAKIFIFKKVVCFFLNVKLKRKLNFSQIGCSTSFLKIIFALWY